MFTHKYSHIDSGGQPSHPQSYCCSGLAGQPLGVSLVGPLGLLVRRWFLWYLSPFLGGDGPAAWVGGLVLTLSPSLSVPPNLPFHSVCASITAPSLWSFTVGPSQCLVSPCICSWVVWGLSGVGLQLQLGVGPSWGSTSL